MSLMQFYLKDHRAIFESGRLEKVLHGCHMRLLLWLVQYELVPGTVNVAIFCGVIALL